mmetsp:Transcript_26891/g.75441  ORF Transcript_26891/g.75441 Transcript_26891/m.75441 type:complete len:137 (+) Transcript_26891:165-575(+)|eukprot:scaffold119636_cov30-Tisochrysis_lutea.AAC.5
MKGVRMKRMQCVLARTTSALPHCRPQRQHLVRDVLSIAYPRHASKHIRVSSSTESVPAFSSSTSGVIDSRVSVRAPSFPSLLDVRISGKSPGIVGSLDGQVEDTAGVSDRTASGSSALANFSLHGVGARRAGGFEP